MRLQTHIVHEIVVHTVSTVYYTVKAILAKIEALQARLKGENRTRLISAAGWTRERAQPGSHFLVCQHQTIPQGELKIINTYKTDVNLHPLQSQSLSDEQSRHHLQLST